MTTPLLDQLDLKIGFGFMNASWQGAPGLTDPAARQSVVNALRLAMDLGVQLFDTADIYAPTWDTMGHNELLLAEAFHGWNGTAEQKARIVLATKAGITRRPGEVWGRSANLDYLLRASEASAGRLGVVTLPLWQHHRLDPNMPFAQQVESLAGIKERGLAQRIGVCNYSAAQLRQALDVLGGPRDGGLVSVQNQLNPAYRQELDVLEVCQEFELAYLPWSPMKGVRASESAMPVYKVLTDLAALRSVTPFAVTNAWLRSMSPNMVPLPGVTRAESVRDSLAGLNLKLGTDELEQLANLPASLPMDSELLSDQPNR